jgi:membrane associated rhomboid family serine protease
MNELIQAIFTIVDQTKQNMTILFILLGVMWGVFILTQLTGKRLLFFGIIPRHVIGLPGIFLSPFLHANTNHIFFNSIPFFILSNFLLIQGLNVYLNVTLYITLLSGLLVWLFARPAIHVGASGLITGYWSYLMLDAYTQGGALTILLAIVCVYYFAGIFFGIFPQQRGVSWEGHLFGLVAGMLVNYGLIQGVLPLLALS